MGSAKAANLNNSEPTKPVNPELPEPRQTGVAQLTKLAALFSHDGNRRLTATGYPVSSQPLSTR
jgi:hypothetical protein